jgi:hypothetical protein
MKKYFFIAPMLILSLTLFNACGGGSSSSSTSSGGGTTTGTNTTNGIVNVAPSSTSQTKVTVDANTELTFSFPAGAVNQSTKITIAPIALNALPVPLSKPEVKFTANSGNVFITAFSIASDNSSVTVFTVPINLSGTVSSAAGTTLNLAKLVNGAWVDVSTLTVGTGGVFTQSFSSTSLQGILAVGTYVIYKPAAGSSTAVSNLGIAIIADDGHGSGSAAGALQVVHIFDSTGTPLAQPTISYLSYSNAYDIDGTALTPDGSQGIVVDGGNTVRFFSNVQTGVPIASTTTIDISSYGGDGDSVAIMPTGDEAVVSGDSSSVLLVVSGIASGTPARAETITIPDARDGVLISNDGKVLLARGYTGLTVFSIASITPAAGSLGGTMSHGFTQTANFTALGDYSLNDGRKGIAISPVDSSRAVVISGSTITQITGMPDAPAQGSTVTMTGVTGAYSVSVTPDGKSIIVGTNAGLVMLSGMDTGTLAQVGTPFAPSYTGGSGSVSLASVTTLGVTLDGKYVVACDAGSYSYGYGTSNGNLVVIPITSTGFSAPVGVLTGVAIPDNDQLVIH